MTQARIKHFASMTLIQLNGLTYRDFMVSEIEELIAETPLRDDDKRLCVAFFIKAKTFQEVADEFNVSVDTAKRRRKDLREALIQTIVKMFFQYEEDA